MQGIIILSAVFVESVAPGLGQATLGGVAGYALGYATKKVIKILMIFAGILIGLATLLTSQDIISVNWPLIENVFNTATSNPGASAQNLAAWLGTYIPITGGLFAGFLLGFRKG